MTSAWGLRRIAKHAGGVAVASTTQPQLVRMVMRRWRFQNRLRSASAYRSTRRSSAGAAMLKKETSSDQQAGRRTLLPCQAPR